MIHATFSVGGLLGPLIVWTVFFSVGTIFYAFYNGYGFAKAFYYAVSIGTLLT